MPWIYIGMSPLKAAYVWTTTVRGIYIGTTKVRPPLPYLCFTANTTGSTIKLKKVWSPTSVNFETSTDGSTWATYTFWNTITLSSVGSKVFWRNKSTTTTSLNGSWWSDYYRFEMTGSISWSGDVNYMLNKNSTTTLTAYCYSGLFLNCTSLVISPELPATTLANYCYRNMFDSTGIVEAPKLPATTLKSGCYNVMFNKCYSLVKAPVLSATSLANDCYANMFQNCTNLDTLPKLPATTLPSNCYFAMFTGCSKIKLSTTQTWDYQTAYRIPTTWSASAQSNSLNYMFNNTWGTLTWTPSINTTYYTSNTLV